MYAYEPGIKIRAGRFSGALTAFDLEYLDTPQRRAIVFPGNVVGTSIFGFQVVRQDAAGLAYIAQDIRPIGTSVNFDRARIRGFEANGDVRLARQWTATAYYAMSNGRLQSTGEYLRRMSPPLGGARLRWNAGPDVGRGGRQLRADADAVQQRRPHRRADRRHADANLNRELLQWDGNRSRPRQRRHPSGDGRNGRAGADAAARLGHVGPAVSRWPRLRGRRRARRPAGDVALRSDRDRREPDGQNYRWYGSGVDSPGVNLEMKARYRF